MSDLRAAAIEEVARWIGQSGYARHITDNDRAWAYCLSEAEGLLFGEYGEPTAANLAIRAALTSPSIDIETLALKE